MNQVNGGIVVRNPASRLALILSALALLAACSNAEPLATVAAPSDPDVTEEFALLQSSEWFYPACGGFNGDTPTAHARAFRAILEHPRADDYFRALLDESGLPGQIYGLAGVYFTDSATFDQVLPRYLDSTELVVVASGDLLERATVEQLAADVASGTLADDLRSGTCDRR